MDCARDELLPGAALALNQDRRAARGRLDDEVEHAAHRGPAADDVVEVTVPLLVVLSECAILVHQMPSLERVLHHDQHFVVLERFGDVVKSAALHRRNGVLDRGVSRHHDDSQLVVQLLERVERRKTIDAGHHHIDNGSVEGDIPSQLDAFLAAGGQSHGVPSALSRVSRISRMMSSSSITRIEPLFCMSSPFNFWPTSAAAI